MTLSMDTVTATATRTAASTVPLGNNTINNKDKRKGGARPGSGRPRTRARKAIGLNKDVKKLVFQNEIVQAAVILADLSVLRRTSKHNSSDREYDCEYDSEFASSTSVNDRDDTEERLQLSSAADDDDDEREEPCSTQLVSRVSLESIDSTEENADADATGPTAPPPPPPTPSITIISSLHPNDVLIGHNDWPGTRRYYAWVDARKTNFHMSSKRSERARLAKEVTGLVLAQNPHGRFLRFIKQQGWFAIDETSVLTEVGKDFRGIMGGGPLALPTRPPPPPHLARSSLPGCGPRFPAASYLPTMPQQQQRAPFRGPLPPHMASMAPPPPRGHAFPPKPPSLYAGMRTTSTGSSSSRDLTPPAGARGYPRDYNHGRAGAGAGFGDVDVSNKDPRYMQYMELSRHSRRVSTDGSTSTGSHSGAGGSGESFSEHPTIVDNKTLLKKPRLSTKRSTSDASSLSTTSFSPSAKNNEEPPSKKARRPHSFWGPKEDDELRRAVEKNGEKWSTVALDMVDCSSEQCRYRWTHCLDPEINRDPLTTDEYRAILEHQAKVGNKWSKLAKELSGRTDHFIRKYWTCAIRPKIVRYLMHARGVEAADVLATEGCGFDYRGNELEGALHFLLTEIEQDKIQIVAPLASKQEVTA